MKIKFKLTEKDVVKAMQLHGRGSLAMFIFLVAAAVFFLMVGFFTDRSIAGFVAFAVEIVGYALILFLLIPTRAKKQYQQHRVLRQNMKMTISEDGIVFKNEIGEGLLKWSDIQKWKYSGGIYLLYIPNNLYHVVPADALPSECDLSQLLSEHVGPKKL